MKADNELARMVETMRNNSRNTVLFHFGSNQQLVQFDQLYAEIQDVVQNALAAGIKPGQHIALICENGKPALLLDLACLQMGCTLIQIPENTAADTLALVGADTLDFIIASPACLHQVDQTRWQITGELAGLTLAQNLLPVSNGEVPAGPVIFSSGTSGRVKKIRVNNATVLHNAANFFKAIGAGPQDRFLIFLPFSSYQQKLLVYGCIAAGVDMVISNIQQVMTALKLTAPTLFLAPPVLYETALRLAGSNSAALRASFGGRMRQMWSGMAPISAGTLGAYQAAGLPLLEAYGMTEYGPIAANLAGANRPGSVGRALVPGSVSLAPDGEILLASSRRLTTGYVDQPAAVQDEVYLDAEHIATGDVGQIDADGYLFLLGRKKETIVTSGGQKIHPSPVEQCFNSLPGVTQAVLMGNGQPHLGLLLVADEEAGIQLQTALKARIHEFNLQSPVPIRSWHFISIPFSTENGTLTRNMKLHRGNINQQYEALVFGAAGQEKDRCAI